MEKAALILPYFGSFDNLFPVFLNSCGKNSQIDWLIFTDQHYAGQIPANVHFHHMTFAEMKKYIQRNYDFKISLNSPYRLCNFKPAYGDIFSEYLTQFDYWGYCDCDLIWGNIGKYFAQYAGQYDRMGNFGHFTLLRNTDEINHLYRNKDAFKVAFSHDYSLFLEEIGFYKIFQASSFTCAPEPCLADFLPRHFNFHPVARYEFMADLPWRQIFTWDNGTLRRWALANDTLVSTEVFYIHFLKRQMFVSDQIMENSKWLIVPNKIIELSGPVSAQMVLEYSKPRFYYDYWRRGLTPSQIIKKLRQRFSLKRKNLMRQIEKTCTMQ